VGIAGEQAMIFSGLSGNPLPCPSPVATIPTIGVGFVREREAVLRDAVIKAPARGADAATFARIPEMTKVWEPA
jgi:hypothetical protein